MTTTLQRAVEALRQEFTIGTYSTFCDEVDFDEATPAEIEAVLKPYFEEAITEARQRDYDNEKFKD